MQAAMDADTALLDWPVNPLQKEPPSAEPARWCADPTGVLFGVRLFDAGTLYRLTVEQTAAIWDWAVWQVGQPLRVQCGVAVSREQAVREAEHAVEALEHDGEHDRIAAT